MLHTTWEIKTLHRHVCYARFWLFFYQIVDDARHYDNQADLFLCGDFNGRVVLIPDFVEQTGLDRFVDLPESNETYANVTVRSSDDKTVSMFGLKLVSFCKELGLCIANGRLEPGWFTFQPSTGCSVVDYFITKTSNFKYISKMEILDPYEFSNHCSMYISMSFTKSHNEEAEKLLINYFGIMRKHLHYLIF